MREKIYCDRCGVKTKFTHYEYETYMKKEFKIPQYKCPICGEEFVGDESLNE